MNLKRKSPPTISNDPDSRKGPPNIININTTRAIPEEANLVELPYDLTNRKRISVCRKKKRKRRSVYLGQIGRAHV